MKKLLLLTLTLAGLTIPALANDMCLARRYDAAHLAKHPDQSVTSMVLALTEHINTDAHYVYEFQLALTQRGNNKLYVQLGDVENRNGEYRGIVECDGGGFRLEFTPPSALLSIGLGKGYSQTLRMAVVPDPCGESQLVDNSVAIESGKDDDTFRLDAASNRVCRAVFDSVNWNAVSQQNQ
jgi:hypothetical protein